MMVMMMVVVEGEEDQTIVKSFGSCFWLGTRTLEKMGLSAHLAEREPHHPFSHHFPLSRPIAKRPRVQSLKPQTRAR